MKYTFRYSGLGGWLAQALGLGPRFSAIEVGDDTVKVRLGWGFRASIPRTSITSAAPASRRTFSRGVHGWRGRWLVNGSGEGLVVLTVEPLARARVAGVPIKLRQLTVSVVAPSELIEALTVG